MNRFDSFKYTGTQNFIVCICVWFLVLICVTSLLYDFEQASVELQGIKGMWSLRSSTDDPHDTFLVVSFISETRILAMNLEDELEETEIEGFCSQVQTLFCHDAVFNQLVQVGYLSLLSLRCLFYILMHIEPFCVFNMLYVLIIYHYYIACFFCFFFFPLLMSLWPETLFLSVTITSLPTLRRQSP